MPTSSPDTFAAPTSVSAARRAVIKTVHPRGRACSRGECTTCARRAFLDGYIARFETNTLADYSAPAISDAPPPPPRPCIRPAVLAAAAPPADFEPGRVPLRIGEGFTLDSPRAARALTPQMRRRVQVGLWAMREVEREREAAYALFSCMAAAAPPAGCPYCGSPLRRCACTTATTLARVVAALHRPSAPPLLSAGLLDALARIDSKRDAIRPPAMSTCEGCAGPSKLPGRRYCAECAHDIDKDAGRACSCSLGGSAAFCECNESTSSREAA